MLYRLVMRQAGIMLMWAWFLALLWRWRQPGCYGAFCTESLRTMGGH